MRTQWNITAATYVYTRGADAFPKITATNGCNFPGGIVKHNTNVVKNLAATQAFHGDNADEGSSPEAPAKMAKQPAKPAGPGPGWCWGQGGRAGHQTAVAAVAAAATRD
eukprot:jgi/Tetstr1/464816/TSEL_009555.t1